MAEQADRAHAELEQARTEAAELARRLP
jgi:hypothetical protein